MPARIFPTVKAGSISSLIVVTPRECGTWVRHIDLVFRHQLHTTVILLAVLLRSSGQARISPRLKTLLISPKFFAAPTRWLPLCWRVSVCRMPPEKRRCKDCECRGQKDRFLTHRVIQRNAPPCRQVISSGSPISLKPKCKSQQDVRGRRRVAS